MKKIVHRRLSKKIIRATIIIPLIMCVAVVVGICLNTYCWSQVVREATDIQTAALESAYNSQSLVLSLIGIAISVWVGLNIYNVISKEELRTLLEQAEEAANITSRVYTESLKSKFRVSFANRTANYFITQLDSMDVFPDIILEKFLEIEDLFNFSYNLYGEELSTQFNQIGLEKAGQLIELAKEHRTTGNINKEQEFFLRGYCALRSGDFQYFRVQYDSDLKGAENRDKLRDLVNKSVQNYKAALYNLFRIRDIRHCGDPKNYTLEERISLSILANNIGSAFLVKKEILDELSPAQLDEIIAAQSVAVDFSAEIPGLTRSVYIRNLGAAYEKRGMKAEALEQYCKAFDLNRQSWRSAYCIGAWYGKEIHSRFAGFPAESEVGMDGTALALDKLDTYCRKLRTFTSQLKAGRKEELTELLLKSTYWYEIKVAHRNQLTDKWLVVRYSQLYVLTKNEVYHLKKEESIKQLEFQNEVLAAKAGSK